MSKSVKKVQIDIEIYTKVIIVSLKSLERKCIERLRSVYQTGREDPTENLCYYMAPDKLARPTRF